MNLNFKEISKTEFELSTAPLLFENNLSYRSFGIVSNESNHFKFGWQSTITKPILTPIKESVYSIGIDIIFVIFKQNTGCFYSRLELSSYFYDVEVHKGFIYIATEMDIIKMNINDFEIKEIYGLPEIYSGMIFQDNILVVSCFDDQVVSFKI